MKDKLQRAIDLILGGKNCLVLGGAGTGKSTLIKSVESLFPDSVSIISSTGIAAINVGGKTFHTAFKAPSANPFFDKRDIRNIKHVRQVYGVNSNIKTLIIDEVGSFSSAQLYFIDQTLKKVRKSNEPFGGLQVCMFGDFFQAGPVIKKEFRRDYFEKHGYPEVFHYNEWGNLEVETVVLEVIHRQKDPLFVEILNRIQKGTQTDEDLDILNKKVGPNKNNSPVICVTNANANSKNEAGLRGLNGPVKTYEGSTVGKFKPNEMPVPLTLKLKVGASVVLCANILEEGIANGDVGTITELKDSSVTVDFERVGERDIKQNVFVKCEMKQTVDEHGNVVNKQYPVGEFSQIPLKLAYGMTVHKSQGKTMDKAHVDLEYDAFAEGMVYVALSRLRSMDGLTLERPIRADDIKVNKRVYDFMESLIE